jgi:uncharacterized membrane protein YphA (DoxX/SURF4 family)
MTTDAQIRGHEVPGSIDRLAWTVLSVPTRLALGAIFLAAAWFKLRPAKGPLSPIGPQDFAFAIKAFKLGLPDALVKFSAFAVPWTEGVAAMFLILGLFTRAAAWLIGLMLGLFTLLIVSAILRGIDVKCGCFGDSGLVCPGAAGWCKVVENGVMVAAALALAMTRTHPLSLDRLLFSRRG